MSLAVGAPAELREAVVGALSTVRDPELDEPLTDLGFVAQCDVDESGEVHVVLRLPTYFCAPNFAYLMVADADDAVRAVDGVSAARVELVDHFTADQVNAGVAARRGFVSAFGSEAESELDELRHDFLVKALVAQTDRVCRPLLAEHSPDALARMTLGDAPPGEERDRLHRRRVELGWPAGPDAPLLLDAHGERVPPDQAPQALARARLTRVNTEANTGICRGMLHDRYTTTGIGERKDDER